MGGGPQKKVQGGKVNLNAGKPDVDESKPTTQLRVRLHNNQ